MYIIFIGNIVQKFSRKEFNANFKFPSFLAPLCLSEPKKLLAKG